MRHGFAREQSTEQLLEILQKCRDFGLTHVTDNIRHKPSFICSCGACLPACQRGALQMVECSESYTPPYNRREMMKQRLLERGRATLMSSAG